MYKFIRNKVNISYFNLIYIYNNLIKYLFFIFIYINYKINYYTKINDNYYFK